MRGICLSIAALLLASCTGAAQMSADTSCSDYIQADSETRAEAVRRVGSELGTAFAGNPMTLMSLDQACTSSPNRTIGHYLEAWSD